MSNSTRPTVEQLVAHLKLLPHPEGGYYNETYRATESTAVSALPARFSSSSGNSTSQTRSFSTGIYFLMTAGNFSAFHRITADEGWHFYAGDALLVHIIAPDGTYSCLEIGANLEKGQRFQGYVPHGCWFASETTGEYSLVGCTVAPGFDFADFELAKKEELAKEFPQHAELIRRLCRQ